METSSTCRSATNTATCIRPPGCSRGTGPRPRPPRTGLDGLLREANCGKPFAMVDQFVAFWLCRGPDFRASSRRNGRPRTGFGVIDCARNCIECSPGSSPRYTPGDSVIPLTGGRFEGRIPTFGKSVRALAPGACEWMVKSWLSADHQTSGLNPFPPAPRAETNQTGCVIRTKYSGNNHLVRVVHNLAGQLRKNASACLEPEGSGWVPG